MIDEGQTSLGGKIPVNVSGGLLSKGIHWVQQGSRTFTNSALTFEAKRELGKWKTQDLGWRMSSVWVLLAGFISWKKSLNHASITGDRAVITGPFHLERYMRIGVVSDTHNNLANCRKIVALFNEAEVDLVIHTGDVTQAKTIEVFGELSMPMMVSLAIMMLSVSPWSQRLLERGLSFQPAL